MTCSAPVTIPINNAGMVFTTDTQGSTFPSGYDYSMWFVGAAQHTNGPPHEPVYVDAVWGHGVNMGGLGVKKDAGKQYAAWHMESKFYQGPSEQSPLTEVFLHVVDVPGQARRPMAWVGTHDGSFGNVNLAASLITFQGHNHEPKLAFDFRSANACRVEDGFSFVFADNGVPVARQYNAAGTSAHALPYIDDADMTAIARPITTPVSNGVAAGPSLSSRGASTSAARFLAPDANASSTTWSCGKNGAKKEAIAGIDNGNNFVVGQTGTGGSMFRDFNASVIWRARQAAYAKVMELTASALCLYVPLKHKVYTMATKPVPSPALKGSEILIEDHPEHGIIKAICDGTQWRHLSTLGAAI